MSDPDDDAPCVEEPATRAQAEDAAAAKVPKAFFVELETEGLGTFSAGGVNTGQGATGFSFWEGKAIQLIARPERGHRFDHWEFRNGDGNPRFGGTSRVASVAPSPLLVIKAFFEEVA
jgi:hypothetical protein